MNSTKHPCPKFFILLTILTACSSTPTKPLKPKTPKPQTIQKLGLVGRMILTWHGGLSQNQALLQATTRSFKALANNPQSSLWLLRDPRPAAYVLPKHIFISTGTLSLVARRSLDIQRKPYDPGRALLSIFARLLAHQQLHSKTLLADIAAIDLEPLEPLLQATIRSAKCARIARRLQLYRSHTWDSKASLQANQRAIQILRSHDIPAASLLDALQAFSPPEQFFSERSTESLFLRRFIPNSKLQTLRQQIPPPQPLSPKQVSRGLELGQRSLSLKKFWKAQRTYLRALIHQPRRPKLARQLLENSLLQFPNNINFVLLDALLSLQQGDLENAERLLRRATHIDPNFFDARYHLAQIYLQRAWTEAANLEAKAAIRLAPASHKAMQSMALLTKLQGKEQTADFQLLAKLLQHK